jgi:hypothetical protein
LLNSIPKVAKGLLTLNSISEEYCFRPLID